MKNADSFVGQPVRSLQTMLRVISKADPSQPSVIPDGFYGRNTRAAVSAFQRNHALAVTGIADLNTWNAIAAVYEDAWIDISEAEALYILLEQGQIIREGEKNPNLYVVQAVLTVLSESLSSIPAPGMSGILDLPTANSLSAFQALSGLPVTGTLDKKTWQSLALHYPLAAAAATM